MAGDLTRYREDPVAFVREVLASRPWSKQVEILTAVRDHPRTTVRACHGVGKSWTAAATVLWFLHTRAPAIVLTTAPSRRQVKQILWREIRAQQRRAKLPGELSETGIEVAEDHFALGLATNEPERFQGFHGEHLLVVVDEASGVAEEIYEAIEGALTAGSARLLLIGNPTRIAGTFYDSHTIDPQWCRIHISAFDSPNLTGAKEGLTPADLKRLVTPEWIESRKSGWGEESARYEVRVLGQFPTKGTDTLVPLAWVDAAVANWRWSTATDIPCEIGVDVARFGDCENVAFVRRGPVVVAMEVWSGQDLMQTAGRVAALIDREQPDAVKIDAVGLGAGVVDRLRELGHRNVVSVSVGARARDSEHYASLRDEIAFGLRERFRDGRILLPPVDGRPDPKLSSQLAALKYSYASDGRLKVESKDEMRRRGLASPDRADALGLCFYQAPRPNLPAAVARHRENMR